MEPEGSLSHSQAPATCPYPKPHQSSLCPLYSSTNIIRVIKLRRMRWAGDVARMGERKDVYRVLVGKPEGKRPLGSPGHQLEDKIKKDFNKQSGMVWNEFIWFRRSTSTLL